MKDEEYKVFSKFLRVVEQYIDASEGHLCDSDFELDGFLSETHAELEVNLIPMIKSLLSKTQTGEPQ